MYRDEMLAAEVEHRLRERTYRRELADPELAWCAGASVNAATGVDLSALTRLARTLILAVTRIL